MSISQLIDQLNKIKAEHGDLPVHVPLHDEGSSLLTGGMSVLLNDEQKPVHLLLLDEEMARAW